MYCINCGREWKDGEVYCGSCGALRSSQIVNQNVNNVNSSVPQTKKGLPTWAIILIIVGGVILVGIIGLLLLVFFIFVAIDSASFDSVYGQTESYVYVGSEEIPTLYEFDMEYELCGYPEYDYDENEESVEYSYCDAYLDTEVFDDYLDYLIDEYDFIEKGEDSEIRTVYKYTCDNCYYISVSVDYYDETIEYTSVDMKKNEEDNSI